MRPAPPVRPIARPMGPIDPLLDINTLYHDQTWFQDPEFPIQPGLSLQDPESWILYPASRPAPGSWTLDPASWILDGILHPGSTILDPLSRTLIDANGR